MLESASDTDTQRQARGGACGESARGNGKRNETLQHSDKQGKGITLWGNWQLTSVGLVAIATGVVPIAWSQLVNFDYYFFMAEQ